MKGIIKSSLGNYGHFNYGSRSRGRLHYPLNNTDGCREFKDEDFDKDHIKEAKEHNHMPLIMVDRGTCHFVLKSQHI